MFNKLSLAGLALASLALGQTAHATPQFTVNETVVPGSAAFGGSAVVADKLNGSYNELLTIFAPGNFATQAYGDFTALVNGATSVGSALGGVFNQTTFASDQTGNLLQAAQYRLFFTFEAAGVLSGPGQFTGSTGTFRIWADPNRNTSALFGATGSSALTLGNTGDDLLIASANTVEYGLGNVANPGSFEIVWKDFLLTNFGKTYFIQPDPFFMRVLVDGDFDAFSPNILGHVLGTQVNYDVRGDVSAVFLVPEPTSLALAGLALVGLAALGRRKA